MTVRRAAPFNPHAQQPASFELPLRNVLHFDPTEPLPKLLVKNTKPTVLEPIRPATPAVEDALRAVAHFVRK